MKVESIAECSHWSILQYFWPALSDGWSWNQVFGLFESGGFTQVLLYVFPACFGVCDQGDNVMASHLGDIKPCNKIDKALVVYRFSNIM